MNYIGPFLRINTLTEENIKNQLLHFSRESIKHIVLFSRCGVPLEGKDFPTENLPNSDISILKSFSPLLCVYKKGNSKMINKDYDYSLKEDSFNREVNIYPNVFMTLSLLNISDYYKRFKDIDEYKFFMGNLYQNLAEKQLLFYAENLRNNEGLFINKKDVSEKVLQDYKFEEKNEKFRFSHQSLMMAAYQKCASQSEDKNDFRNFSNDILDMLISYRDEIYTLDFQDLLMLTLSLNIYYDYVKDDKVKSLLLDSCDYLKEYYKDKKVLLSDRLDYRCLLLINYWLLYKNTGLISYKDEAILLGDRLIEEYDKDKGLIKSDENKKDIDYTSDEIILFNLFTWVYFTKLKEDEPKILLYDIYKRTIIDSPIVLSWPAAPDSDDAERYRNFSKKVEDMLGEDCFKMPLLKTPEETGLMPCFGKKISYNRKKQVYRLNKKSFYSENNLFLDYLILYILN
ncbi:MAG: hypothetical protein WCQ54_10460 [Clostridiaceae bacterium]